MTTEKTGPRGSAPGLRSLVHAALPDGAVPTGTSAHALPRYVMEHAQGDVVALTRQRMSDQLKEEDHVVLVLRAEDLDPRTDGDVLSVAEQTDGGVVVFGVTYSTHRSHLPPGEPCPECGAESCFVVTEGRDTGGRRTPDLLECRECEAVWDSAVP